MGQDARFQALQAAAADYTGNGAIELPEFEPEILDHVRRGSIVLQRVSAVPATGHPHRYFEQTDIASAGFADPRNLTATASGPTRVERPAFIKAITAQTNFGLFDRNVTEQQGKFTSVIAKDMNDIVEAVQKLRGKKFWTGNDTNLGAPTTQEYVGVLTQITQQATIAPSSSIISGLKTMVAMMVGNAQFDVKPTAIYLNPLLIDLIEQEALSYKRELGTVEVVAGVTVKALSTQAGILPLIPDPYLPVDSAANYGFSIASGNKNYYAVIVAEDEIERPYISGAEDNPNPRLFQLGLQAGLAGQYVAVCFDAVIAKGASYAHAVCAVQRP